MSRNWKRFIKYVANEEILQNAQDSLVRFFGNDFDFSDKVFLDIGCRSGIFSIGALNLGCKRVASIDVDNNSIEATQMAKDKFKPKNTENWKIFLGSILDFPEYLLSGLLIIYLHKLERLEVEVLVQIFLCGFF